VGLAWLAWGGAWLADGLAQRTVAVAARYGALCLTGCAGVAVLGARRPVLGAWHVVVVGLLAVLLLPLGEGWGRLQLSPPRILFLSITLGVGFVNYVPTRLGPAAVLAAAGCAMELWSLVSPEGVSAAGLIAGRMALAVSPWVALVFLAGRPAGTEFDQTWRGFRDRYGGLWGQRVREQFNRAAANAGWDARLAWGGLRFASDPRKHEQALETLRALLKRFGPRGAGDDLEQAT
jgi:hypothetical protein